MKPGDRVTLNGDTGTVVDVWPDGHDAQVCWQPGPSRIAGRTLWCPTAYLTLEGQPAAHTQPISLEQAFQMAMSL